ncbi:GAF sensor signal transduction histidine kinase [Calothrix sp. NIES-4071]|nr:GAF sensor signal transduction histidine kinase [Calothrix sp. NIES-4071]BAZ60831.1 GAF sensor signal transduction histidine kinase [Calothrix sp. NIES-4105]
MFYPGEVLIATFDVRLIILSIAIAIVGSCIALDIAEQIFIASGRARVWWLLGGATTLGISIWVMHFTAILSYKLPIRVDYNYTTVMISMVVAIVGSGIGFYLITRSSTVKWLMLFAGSIFIGGAVIGMHFTAMSALLVPVQQLHDLKLFILSGLVSIGISFAALSLTFYKQVRIPLNVQKVGSTLLMGVAICGMHYIAIAGVRFRAVDFLKMPKMPPVDNTPLVIAISIAALITLILAELSAFFGRRLSAEVAKTEVLRQSEEKLELLVKQRTAELEMALSAASSANEAKTQFLANMNHELRTPLNGIIGFSSILLEQTFGVLNEKQQQYINVIYECGYQQLNLINDLLDIAKIEAGKEELEIVTLSVEEICHICISVVSEEASKRGLQLLLDISPEITTCNADGRRLKQILLNLLSNALKFTESGSVTLKVDSEAGFIKFAVIDTGIGISQEEGEKLFELFQQFGSSFRKRQGTGLGLAVSRNLARLHGGDIILRSEVGRGSCFTLLLPL